MARPIPGCVDSGKVYWLNRVSGLRWFGDDEYDRVERLLADAGYRGCPCAKCGGASKLYSTSPMSEEEIAILLALPCIAPEMSVIEHYLLAGLRARDLEHPWEGFDHPDHEETITLFGDHIEMLVNDGMGLTLLGTMGTGKTSAATYLVRRAVDRWSCKWVTFTNFDAAIAAYNDERLSERLETSRLVVIDEVRTGHSDKQREFYDNRVTEIIVGRYQAQRATIITANHTNEELATAYPRMMSRLTEMNETLNYTGTDFRKQHPVNIRELAARTES